MRSLLAWLALAPLLFDSAPPRVQQSEYGLRDIHFMAPGGPHNVSLVDFYRVALFRVYFDQPLYARNMSLGGRGLGLGLGLGMDEAPHPFPLGDAWGGALDGVVTLRCPNNRVFRSSPRCGVENLAEMGAETTEGWAECRRRQLERGVMPTRLLPLPQPRNLNLDWLHVVDGEPQSLELGAEPYAASKRDYGSSGGPGGSRDGPHSQMSAPTAPTCSTNCFTSALLTRYRVGGREEVVTLDEASLPLCRLELSGRPDNETNVHDGKPPTGVPGRPDVHLPHRRQHRAWTVIANHFGEVVSGVLPALRPMPDEHVSYDVVRPVRRRPRNANTNSTSNSTPAGAAPRRETFSVADKNRDNWIKLYERHHGNSSDEALQSLLAVEAKVNTHLKDHASAWEKLSESVGSPLLPQTFIGPVANTALGNVVEQILQKYTNYLDSTMQARLSGFFTGTGDDHRELVPTWEAVDQAKEIQAKQDLMKSMAEVEKVHAEAKAEAEKAKADDEAAVAAEAGKAAGKEADAEAAQADADAAAPEFGKEGMLLIDLDERRKNRRDQRGALEQTAGAGTQTKTYAHVASMARAMSTLSRTSNKLNLMVGAAIRESGYQVTNTRRVINRHRKWRRAALESQMIEIRMQHRVKRAALQIRRGQPKEEVHLAASEAATTAREAYTAILDAANANWKLAKVMAESVAAEARVAASTATVLQSLGKRSKFCVGKCRSVAHGASKAAAKAKNNAAKARALTKTKPRVVLATSHSKSRSRSHRGGRARRRKRKRRGKNGRASLEDGDVLVEVDTQILSTVAVGTMTDEQLLAMTDVQELSLIEESAYSMASTTQLLKHSEDIGARERVATDEWDELREFGSIEYDGAGGTTSTDEGPKKPTGFIQKSMVTALSHSLTTELAETLTKKISNNAHVLLNQNLASDLLDVVPNMVANKMSEVLPQAVGTLIGYTVPIVVLRQLPMYLVAALESTLTNTLTRGLTHTLAPTLTHTLSRSTAQEYYCYYCRFMRFGCQYCPESYSNGSQRNTLNALEYYSNYYSDYYAQFFTGNPHPRP